MREAIRRHADGILWRAAAIALMFSLALSPHNFPSASATIGKAYASHFWRPANLGEWFDIGIAFLVWPFGVLFSAIWFTHRNGAIIAERFGPSRIRQFADQLQISVTSGLLPPWYYIFELYRPGRMQSARSYLTRGQTKYGAYRILAEARGSSSPLGDKEAFARFCAERQVRAIPVLFSMHHGALRGPIASADDLPRTDLFVKPVRGRGGRGAERWDFLGEDLYRHSGGKVRSGEQFLERLATISRWQPYLVQERARNHPEMSDLSNGALNTIRIISCLDEQDRPEIIAAVLRMAVGNNVTVDNVHAGGLAAAVDLAQGRLSAATDMGIDVQLGWLDRHPDTNGKITGRILPMWNEVLDLILKAHLAFDDRAVVGWDVAFMADGPRLVEGNSGPDIDLVQRPLRMSFGDARFGELLAWQLNKSQGSLV